MRLSGFRRAVRERLVEGPDSLGERARLRRWEQFVGRFPDIAQLSVLDLGGTVDAWLRAPIRPAHVHLVNLEAFPAQIPSWIEADQADVCDLPGWISQRSYDLVFSNSVIEHLGGHVMRRRFAQAVQTLGPRYWVQTPYRYFPLEPHFLGPGFQFVPIALRGPLIRRWPLVHSPIGDLSEAVEVALTTELLGKVEMRHYFSGAELLTDKVAGVTKSLIAVRSR